VEQQEVHNDEMNLDIIEALKDRYGGPPPTAEETDPGQ
jgi:hypothetical protein